MMPSDSHIALPAGRFGTAEAMAGSVMGEVRTRHDFPAYLQMVASGRVVADELLMSSQVTAL